MRQRSNQAEPDRSIESDNVGNRYSTSPDGGQPLPVTLDQLDYLSDLVTELREMAGRAGLSTLAAILALAQTEASTQIAQARSRDRTG